MADNNQNTDQASFSAVNNIMSLALSGKMPKIVNSSK